MATALPKTAKAIAQEEKDIKDQLDAQTNFIPSNNLNAPKHGTVIPNRVFVGGISSATTESDLIALFSNYGTVTGAKIIADRAGVSKGYGFVTFETEEEAKRLQKDADNIMLRERRLNIAPAIKKQGYGRAPSYECPATPVPMPAQVYRQNGGVPFTFHNGMAFFPQPTHQPMTPGHIETPGVYQQGTHYIPQGSPAAAYQYPYTQGQVIYQAAPQYSYQMPYEGCYEPGLMMHEANLVVPPYYLAPPEGITYYQPAPMHPQDLNPHLSHPIMFPSPQRTFDSSIVYPSEGGGAGRGGGGRGGYHSQHQRNGMEGTVGKYGKEEEGGSSQPLTPPITPKSDSGRATTPSSQQQQTEELVKSIQAVAI